jgi:hypothetical protein
VQVKVYLVGLDMAAKQERREEAKKWRKNV